MLSAARIFSQHSMVTMRASYAMRAFSAVHVPIDLLKKLRERTGSPITECKNALADANLDMEKAIDLLRKKGAAVALKSAGRVAIQGLVHAQSHPSNLSAAVVELNSETDFVARNERFVAALHSITGAALCAGQDKKTHSNTDSNGAISLNMEEIKATKLADGLSVAESVNMLVSAIRENIQLRRAGYIQVDSGAVGSYVHLGRVVALVGLHFRAKDGQVPPQVKALADKLAMHVAALKPPYLSRDVVAVDVVQREEDIQMESARKLGKPENLLKNIVAGKMNKFYEDIVLTEQTFALGETPEEQVKISKLLANEAKKLGVPASDLKITSFLVYQLGSESANKQ